MVERRDYQIEAIDAIRRNNQWQGILNMATGTGKTITSLLCGEEYFQHFKRIFLIVMVPLQHLADQWEKDIRLFDYAKPLKCYSNNNNWEIKLENRIRDFRIGITTKEAIIVVYDTASNMKFQHLISSIERDTFLIADECHNFGMKSFKNHSFSSISNRIGLSATPQRWWDEEGTQRVFNYFNDVVYSYDIEKAITNGNLVRYEYLPQIINLDFEEVEQYEAYTAQLVKLNAIKSNENRELIETISRKRSMILSKARSKIGNLLILLNREGIQNVNHTLVYCAPGEVNVITKALYDIGLKVHRFDSHVALKERSLLLEKFDKGEIQVLVAIKCLDEGVDIPSTKNAYFLSSTSNPREFVQRRGRVLRNSKGKNLAKIYDFVVLPKNVKPSTFRSIASKEMPRFAEFSRFAINKYYARSITLDLLIENELEHLIDKLPWEVYEELKEKYGDQI